MRRVSAVVAAIVLAGCNPKNAVIDEGRFTAFLSTSTSKTLSQQIIDLDGFESHTQLDCRSGVDNKLPNPLAICDTFDPEHERWMAFDGYEVISAPLAPWRGEAVMTSEGDLLLTFHQDLNNGEDFRFAFVVNPNFQPKRCSLGEGGAAVLEPIDGDWIGGWSADVDSGTLFYMNAGSYQFNPSNVEVQWTLPNEWLAGYATANFGAENMTMRSVRYGKPKAYASYELEETAVRRQDLFYGGMEAGTDPSGDADYQALIDSVSGIRDEVIGEFGQVGVALAPRVHTNAWRTPDGNAPGLDGWVELHYNHVRFDQAREELAAGNAASGEFHLVFDGFESQSRVVVQGKFHVDEIAEDRWTVQNLEQDKLEEFGTEVCGQPAAQ